MEKRIINLTQHPASETQKEAGVVEPARERKVKIKEQLTFNCIPTAVEINTRAVNITALAKKEGADAAMIGGAPFLMAPLAAELETEGIQPLFAFSRRIVEEVGDQKIVTFRHEGFVPANIRRTE